MMNISKSKLILNRNINYTILLGKIRKCDYLIKEEAKKVMIDLDYKDTLFYKDGYADGRTEGKAEVTKRMLKKGIEINIISEIMELPIEEVEKLK